MPGFGDIRTGSYRGLYHPEKAYIDKKDIAYARHFCNGIDFKTALKETGSKKYTGTTDPLMSIESDFQHMSLAEAIQLVHKANGKAVLAHPGFVFYNSDKTDEENWGLLAELADVCVKEELDGVEVVSLWHKAEYSYDFLNELKEETEMQTGRIKEYKGFIYNKIKDLPLLTRGSDDHGGYKPRFLMNLLAGF